MKTNNKMKLALLLVCCATILVGCNQGNRMREKKPRATLPPIEAKRLVLKAMPEVVDAYRHGGGDDPNDIPVRVGKPFSIYFTDTKKIKALTPPFGKNVLSRIVTPDVNAVGAIEETLVYPLLDESGTAVYSVEITKQNGRWALAGYPWGSGSLSEVRFMVGIEGFLASRNLHKVSEVKLFSAVEFQFAYIDAAKGQFIVPIEDNERGHFGLDEYGFRANKPYPAEQAWAMIVKAAKSGKQREIWGIGDQPAATEAQNPK